jgi:hypothetical protein
MYILLFMIISKWLVSMSFLAATIYWSRRAWVRGKLDWQLVLRLGFVLSAIIYENDNNKVPNDNNNNYIGTEVSVLCCNLSSTYWFVTAVRKLNTISSPFLRWDKLSPRNTDIVVLKNTRTSLQKAYAIGITQKQ